MPRDPRAYLQRAEEHRRHGRLKEAIALSIEALGKHPGLDAVRVTLGRAYLENAQPEEARTTLQEVFARLPEHHLAGKMLIESQRLLGDLGGAEATCRTLLEHYPRDREIEPLLAEIVRARAAADPSGAAAAGPPAPPAPVMGLPATAPSVAAPSAAPARASLAPMVALRESDPKPEYFPEDIAAMGIPAPQPSAARVAAAPAAVVMPPAPAAPPPVAPVAAAAPALASAAPSSPKNSAVAEPLAEVRIPPARPASTPAAIAAAPGIAPPAAAPKPAAPAPPAPPPAAAQRDALETNTLAELYVKQGLPDRAIEVYRSMLRVEPGNAAARRRLAEIESALAPSAGAPSPSGPSRRADRPRADAPKSPATQAPAPAATAGAAPVIAATDQAAIERLERWLAAVKGGGRDRQGGGAAA